MTASESDSDKNQARRKQDDRCLDSNDSERVKELKKLETMNLGCLMKLTLSEEAALHRGYEEIQVVVCMVGAGSGQC